MNYKKSIFIALALISGHANCSRKNYYIKRNPSIIKETTDSIGKMASLIASPELTALGLEGEGTIGNFRLKIQPVPLEGIREDLKKKLDELGESRIPTGCCLLNILSSTTESNSAETLSPRGQALLQKLRSIKIEPDDFIVGIGFTKNGVPGFAFLGGSKDNSEAPIIILNAAAASSSNQAANSSSNTQPKKFTCNKCGRVFNDPLSLGGHKLGCSPVSLCQYCKKPLLKATDPDLHRKNCPQNPVNK